MKNMTMSVIRAYFRGLFWWMIAAVMYCGCGASERQEARLEDLTDQVAELNRNMTDAHVRIEELNNRLFLIQNRIDEELYNKSGNSPPSDLKVVKLVPEGSDEKVESSKTLTSGGESGYKGNIGGSEEPKVHSNWEMGSLAGGASGTAEKKGKPSAVRRDYEKALELYHAKRYKEAIEAFAGFQRDHGENRYTDNAVFWTGVSHFEKGEYELAIRDFRKVGELPGSNKIPDALYYLGLSQAKKGDIASAEATWKKLQRLYPDSDAARKAVRYL